MAGGYSSVALIFLVGLVGGAIVNFFIPVPIWPSVWLRPAGLASPTAGVPLFASPRPAFRRHGAALVPWTASTELVQDGSYRFTRNQVYLAFALMYLGAALIFDSAYFLIMLMVVMVLFDRLQIPREERYLQKSSVRSSLTTGPRSGAGSNSLAALDY